MVFQADAIDDKAIPWIQAEALNPDLGFPGFLKNSGSNPYSECLNSGLRTTTKA